MNTQSSFASTVFDYTEFQSFLKAHVEFKKNSNRHWTLTKWVDEVGLKATTSITMVINDQRKCGKKIENLLIKYFVFDIEQERYFRLLVKKSRLKSDDPTLKIVEDEIRRCRNQTAPQSILTELSDTKPCWTMLALRQMARAKPLPKDIGQLKEKLYFEIDNQALKQSLKFLIDNGLVIATDKGLVSTEKPLTTTNKSESTAAIQELHDQVIGLAQKSVRKFTPDKRELQARILNIKREDIAKAKDLIRKFQEEFDAILDKKDGDQVYQLSVQLFPLGDNK